MNAEHFKMLDIMSTGIREVSEIAKIQKEKIGSVRYRLLMTEAMGITVSTIALGRNGNPRIHLLTPAGRLMAIAGVAAAKSAPDWWGGEFHERGDLAREKQHQRRDEQRRKIWEDSGLDARVRTRKTPPPKANAKKVKKARPLPRMRPGQIVQFDKHGNLVATFD